jgi:ABC-2 type transport system permease protein
VAVYERNYAPYAGPVTARRWRFLVLPKYSYQDIFASKAFLTFFVACFVWPAIQLIMMYISYNMTFLRTLAQMTGTEAQAGSIFGLTYDGNYFLWFFMLPQFWMSFFLSFIVGPALISGDIRNNGLPLYLSRPFSRADYILGKVSVLAILLSLITWVPGLVLFSLHAYLAGNGWLFDNLQLAAGIFFGSWVSIVLLSLISLSLSAYMRWKPLARLGLFGVFLVAGALGGVINGILHTQWGSLINLGQMLFVVWADMLGATRFESFPAAAAWAGLIVACLAFLAVLARKIRAYEVVRS